MFKEELVKSIKEIGQSLIDNAENIAGDYKYFTDLRIICYPMDKDGYPYYKIERDVIAENTVERINNN